MAGLVTVDPWICEALQTGLAYWIRVLLRCFRLLACLHEYSGEIWVIIRASLPKPWRAKSKRSITNQHTALLMAEAFEVNFWIKAKFKTISEVSVLKEYTQNCSIVNKGAWMPTRLWTWGHKLRRKARRKILKVPPILWCAFGNAGTQRGTASQWGNTETV